jgi:hypothetical protein
MEQLGTSIPIQSYGNIRVKNKVGEVRGRRGDGMNETSDGELSNVFSRCNIWA